jgi:hypothetical protein
MVNTVGAGQVMKPAYDMLKAKFLQPSTVAQNGVQRTNSNTL